MSVTLTAFDIDPVEDYLGDLFLLTTYSLMISNPSVIEKTTTETAVFPDINKAKDAINKVVHKRVSKHPDNVGVATYPGMIHPYFPGKRRTSLPCLLMCS